MDETGVLNSIQRRVGAACTCAMLLLISSESGAANGSTYKLYFLGGQSNMDGYGYVSELPDELRSDVDRAMIFVGQPANDKEAGGGKGVWVRLRPGFGTGFETDGKTNSLSERFGPELGFGMTLSSIQPDSKIALVKYSQGGSGLALDIRYGSWFPEYRIANRPNQYDHALATIRNALRDADIDGDGVADRLVPAGIIWMQGEADASRSRESADAYQANLTRLMNLLRAALRVQKLPVVIGEITDSGLANDGSMMDYLETVQNAQAEFTDADDCATLVTATEELSFLDDAWHYDTDGFIRLGAAFANAVLELEKTCP